MGVVTFSVRGGGELTFGMLRLNSVVVLHSPEVRSRLFIHHPLLKVRLEWSLRPVTHLAVGGLLLSPSIHIDRRFPGTYVCRGRNSFFLGGVNLRTLPH